MIFIPNDVRERAHALKFESRGTRGNLKVKSTAAMTSAEPCRRKAYHSDLRWRIVWQRLALELTFKQIATRLNIAVSTAKSIYSLFEITGDVEPKFSGSRRELRKLDDHMELFILGGKWKSRTRADTDSDTDTDSDSDSDTDTAK